MSTQQKPTFRQPSWTAEGLDIPSISQTLRESELACLDSMAGTSLPIGKPDSPLLILFHQLVENAFQSGEITAQENHSLFAVYSPLLDGLTEIYKHGRSYGYQQGLRDGRDSNLWRQCLIDNMGYDPLTQSKDGKDLV